MKKLKTFIKITAFICIFSITGCEDSLDKAIEGQLPSSDVSYEDLSRMYEPVSGIYATSRSANLIVWSHKLVDQIRTDFIVKGNGSSVQPSMEDILEKYRYNSTEWFISTTWFSHYQIITKANNALLELDKFREFCNTSAELELNDQYRAEIRFWRALAYWRVARYFGDIPWFDKEITSLDFRLSPREEVYAWMIGELKDLREKLPTEHPNQLARKGALTKWAANMLLAKAAADVQDYTTMQQATEEIVTSSLFSLHPDYYEMQSLNGQLADENILELQYFFDDADGSQTYYDAWDWCSAMATTINYKVPIGGVASGFGGWDFSIPSQKYVDLFVNRGETVRYTSSIIYPNSLTPKGDSIGGQSNNLKVLIQKYRDENLPNGVVEAWPFKGFVESEDRTSNDLRLGAFNNIRIFRYADALLLHAEALAHNNGAGAGDQYINLVRQRANMPALSGATVDQILEERGMELSQEWGGDRFFDLVRLGKTSELGSNFIQGVNEFFPTPQEQIDFHPGLAEPPVSGLFPTTFE